MSSELQRSRRPASARGTSRRALPGAPFPAWVRPAAGEPATALVIVADGRIVPSAGHYERWMHAAGELGYTAIRTGALSPRQAEQAAAAGLTCVQELALLELRAPLTEVRRTHRTARLRHRDLTGLAAVDRAAFGERWWLDAGLLGDIRTATPSHRARVVRGGDGPAGFLISGRAGRAGYLQRLAVHPDQQRHGIATALLADALRWMRATRVRTVLVNTHVDNDAALALYRRHGFVDLADRLRVYEGPAHA